MSRRALLQLGAAVAGTLLARCAPVRTAPTVVTTPAGHAVPLVLQPLHALVATAGLEWLVIAQLHQLSQSSVIRPGIDLFFPAGRLDAFEHMTAIELRQVDTALVASYDGANLYLVNGVRDTKEAERRYRDRLLTGVVRSTYSDDVVMVSGLAAKENRRALAALGPSVVAIETGSDRHVKAALLYAMQKLHRTPSVAQSPELVRMIERLGAAPVLAVAPGPFAGEWARGAHGLLAACTTAGASIRITPVNTLQGCFVLFGPWQERAQAAAARLEQSWGDLADSDFGRLTGLGTPANAPIATHAADAIALTVEVHAQRFLEGLHAAVSAQVNEILK